MMARADVALTYPSPVAIANRVDTLVADATSQLLAMGAKNLDEANYRQKIVSGVLACLVQGGDIDTTRVELTIKHFRGPPGNINLRVMANAPRSA